MQLHQFIRCFSNTIDAKSYVYESHYSAITLVIIQLITMHFWSQWLAFNNDNAGILSAKIIST